MSSVENVMKPPYRCASCGHEWTEDIIWCPKCKPMTSGARVSVMTCSGHDEAQQRINRAVHEIQALCDHFGYDPSQWLADSICHPDEASNEWDCLICGGAVDLSNPIKPTEKVGPGSRR